MCEHKTFPLTLVNHVWFTERWSFSELHEVQTGFFLLATKTKGKHPWWSWPCFYKKYRCCLITCVSQVQISGVMVLVWGFIWWWSGTVFVRPQQRSGFRLCCPFFVSCGEKYGKKANVIYLREEAVVWWTWCDFADLSCGSLVRGDSKCFLLLDFCTLGALGLMKY